jgi:hypothetical protein
MPPPRILGQSATTPGMLDVETADGMRRSIPAWMAPRLGLSADLVAGDAAAREMQPAPAPQMAQAPVVEVGDVSVTPTRPRQTASDAVAGAQFRGAQDIARGALDAVTGGAASRVTEALGERLTETGAATDAAAAGAAATQQEAAPTAESATGDVAARQQQTTDRYRQLTIAAAQGDTAALLELDDLAMSGDQRGIDARRRAQVMQQTLAGAPSGGGGGTRLTRTETTQLRQQARPTTDAEAAELQSAAAEQDRAEREGMVALAREAEAEAGALADTASAMQSAQSQLDALERRRQQAEQARQAELMRRQRALDTAASEVGSRQLDPGRMYAKGETRNRTAAAIGLVLGGLADAITGGEAGLTTALGIINTAIDRDIEAQRGNVTIAQQGLAAKQSLLDDMRRTFGDQQAAEEATRATMLEGVERQIQALRLNAASDAQRAALDRMLADIQAQKAAARQAAVMGGIPMTDIVIEQRQQAGGGGGARRPAPIADLPDTGVEQSERVRLQEQDFAIGETILSLDRMAELLDDGALVGPVASRVPFRELISSNAREFDQLSTMLTMSMREDVLGPGTVTEAEKADLFNAVGLTSNLPAADVARAIRNMRAKLMRKRAAMRGSVGQEAVVESERRAPGEREAVTRQSGDLATELGGTRR